MICVLCGNKQHDVKVYHHGLWLRLDLFTQTLLGVCHFILLLFSPHSLHIASSAGARTDLSASSNQNEEEEEKKKNEKQLADQFVSFITNPRIYYISFQQFLVTLKHIGRFTHGPGEHQFGIQLRHFIRQI